MNNRNMYKSFLKKITSDGRVSPEQDCSYPTRLNMSDTSGGFRPMAAVVAWHPPVRADFRAVLRVGGRAAIFVQPWFRHLEKLYVLVNTKIVVLDHLKN